MKNFFKTFWSVICYPLLYLGAQTIVTVVCVIFIVILNMNSVNFLTMSTGDLTDFFFAQIDLQAIVLISCLLVLAITFLIRRKRWAQSRFWRADGFGVLPLLGCIALGVVFNAFMCCVMQFLDYAGVDFSSYGELISLIIGSNPVLEILAVGIAAPFIEEIIFRGIVFEHLRPKMRLSFALVLQALLFGIIHLNLVQGVYAFFIGLVLGLVYLWFDSVWAAFAVHSAFNLTSVIIFSRIESIPLNISAIILAASFVLCGAGLYWIYRRRPREMKN